MNPPTTLFHGGLQSPYGNLNWQEESRASPFVAPATRTQGHRLPLVTFHPVQGDVCVDPVDGRVYTSAREEVPQLRYTYGDTRKGWYKKPPVLFSRFGKSGVRLPNAYGVNFEVDEGDSFPFGTNIRGITIRIHFPGYPSSTDVEKTLKELAKQGRRSKARSMQVSTKDYRVKAEPVTKRKLAQEVSKRVKWHIEDLMNNSDLFPFDCGVEGKWCLGEGLMKFEYMTITAIENVSSGSWSPVIHVDKFLQD